MSVSTERVSHMAGEVRIHTVHDAVTADATSDSINIAGAKSIAIIFTEGGTVNNRSADLTVDVSVDGTNFYDFNMLLDNVADTNSESLTRVSSKTRAAAGTDILFIEPKVLGALTDLKVALDVTDGASPTGNYTVKVAVNR